MQFLLYTRVTTCMYQNQAFLTFHVCLVQHVYVRTEYSLLSTRVWYNVHVSELSIPYFPHVSGTTCMCQNWVFLTFHMFMCMCQNYPYFPHVSGTMCSVRTEYSLLSTRVCACVRTEYSLLSTRVWYNMYVSCIRTKCIQNLFLPMCLSVHTIPYCVWYNVHVSELSIPYFPHVSGTICMCHEYSLSTCVWYNVHVSELSIPYFPHVSGARSCIRTKHSFPSMCVWYNMYMSELSMPYFPHVSGTTCMCQNWVFLTFHTCLVQRSCIRTKHSFPSMCVCTMSMCPNKQPQHAHCAVLVLDLLSEPFLQCAHVHGIHF